MKPFDKELSTSIEFNQENNEKHPTFKMVILLKYQNIKTFLKTFLQLV